MGVRACAKERENEVCYRTADIGDGNIYGIEARRVSPDSVGQFGANAYTAMGGEGSLGTAQPIGRYEAVGFRCGIRMMDDALVGYRTMARCGKKGQAGVTARSC